MYYHYHSCVVVVAADIAAAAAAVVVAGYCPRRVYFLSHLFSVYRDLVMGTYACLDVVKKVTHKHRQRNIHIHARMHTHIHAGTH